MMLEAFLVSTGAVALGEIGDKTQLLALVLAARYRKPVVIMAGIFVATLLNHAAAGAVGSLIAGLVSHDVLRWILGGSFVAMGAWILLPDKLDEDDANPPAKFGVFLTTVIAFFIAEMGDKTQVATVMLATRYQEAVTWVVMGTTLGMMIANVPAVLFGDKLAQKVPVRVIHGVAATLFVVLGLAVLFNLGGFA